MTEADVATFWERGWIRVSAVMPPEELRRVAEHVATVRQPPPSEAHRFNHYPFAGFDGNRCLNERTASEVRDTERLMRLHLFDPTTRALMMDPRLVAIARSVFHGGEPLGAHSAYLPKSPRSPGISLHTDNAYFGSDPPELIGLSVAVDDADATNGALEVVEGSHHVTLDEDSACACLQGESLRAPPGYTLALTPAQAGDVVVFHGSALHGSRANASETRTRRTFVFHYANRATLRSIGSDCQPLLTPDRAWVDVSISDKRR